MTVSTDVTVSAPVAGTAGNTGLTQLPILGGAQEGGGGGGGGVGAAINAQANLRNISTISGGAGGAGGDDTVYGGGGGGGGAGVFSAGGSLTNTGTVSGGAGRAGGNAYVYYGGGGGGGGTGVVFSAGGNLVNSGAITGGDGGNGGGPEPGGGIGGGGGGGGGHGVTGANLNIVNRGTITGGAGGNAVSAILAADGGGGGAGIAGANLSISNSGTITGGAGGVAGVSDFSYTGAAGSQGPAVYFSGGANTLTLQTGSVLNGAIWVVSGATATVQAATNNLALSGGLMLDGNATIDTQGNTLTQAGVISGAGSLTKTGAGILTLSGTNIYSGGTTISAGALQGDTNSLQGNITDNASLIFNQGVDDAFGGAISGTGSLTKTGAGVLTLTGTNSYTGTTLVDAGTLAVAAGASIVLSGGASVSSGATLDLSAVSDPSVGWLGGSGGTVGIGGNVLTISGTGNGNFAGGISGTGSLIKQGSGTQTLSGASNYSGGTSLQGGTLALGNSQALGSGTLAMDDNTTLAFAADGLNIANPVQFTGIADPSFDTGAFTATLSGGISGAADLTKIGSGTLILGAANNSYTGATTVSQGTLKAGVAGAFSAVSTHTVAAGATLDTSGLNQTVAALTNAGTVSLTSGAPGSTLTVTGNYVGSNGLLRLGTALGDSSSVSDKLMIGGSASGSTVVQIINLGALGALTTGNGIQVIGATGGIAPNAFSLANGHVDAGAFEYRLTGTANAEYLSSISIVVPGSGSGSSSDSGSGSGSVLGSTSVASSSSAPAVGLPLYRSEVPLLAAVPAQLRQGSLAMLGDLHSRLGDDDAAQSAFQDTGGHLRRAWGRLISTNLNLSQAGLVNPRSNGRLSGFQAGTDLWVDPHWHAGLYVGQLDGDAQVNGFARGVFDLGVGYNELHSRYLGAYATYNHDSGLYVDGVLQAGRHRYDIHSVTELPGNDNKGSSVLASVEAGETFALDAAGRWQLEPQVQLVHQNLGVRNVQIPGATVQEHADSGWLARLGLRIKGHMPTALGSLQPYARVSVYRRSGGTDVAEFIAPGGATAVASAVGGTSTQLALGATLALNARTSVYGELAKLWDTGGDARMGSGVQGSLGVKVSW